jgi:hypothetical protein
MKSPNKILVKILHSVPVLSSLTVSQLQRLADVLTEVTVRSAASLRAAVGASALHPTQSNETKSAGKARRSLYFKGTLVALCGERVAVDKATSKTGDYIIRQGDKGEAFYVINQVHTPCSRQPIATRCTQYPAACRRLVTRTHRIASHRIASLPTPFVA